MLTRNNAVEILKREIPYLKDNFGVKKIALFGSFATNSQTEKSDVDIVVEFERPAGFNFLDMADYLEKVLGRKIDILTADALKTIRIKEVTQAIKGHLVYV